MRPKLPHDPLDHAVDAGLDGRSVRGPGHDRYLVGDCEASAVPVGEVAPGRLNRLVAVLRQRRAGSRRQASGRIMRGPAPRASPRPAAVPRPARRATPQQVIGQHRGHGVGRPDEVVEQRRLRRRLQVGLAEQQVVAVVVLLPQRPAADLQARRAVAISSSGKRSTSRLYVCSRSRCGCW